MTQRRELVPHLIFLREGIRCLGESDALLAPIVHRIEALEERIPVHKRESAPGDGATLQKETEDLVPVSARKPSTHISDDEIDLANFSGNHRVERSRPNLSIWSQLVGDSAYIEEKTL